MRKYNLRCYVAMGMLLTALCGLSACTAELPKAVPEAAAAATPVAVAPAAENDAARQNMLSAYRAALDALLHQHVLPDGTDCGYDAASDPAGNRFAVLDVDGDGQDELIVSYTATYMAGQVQGIFGYDGGERLHTEFIEYPMLTFYGNGVIQAGWSHNQGLADSFWPYSLYRYDAAADSYRCVGMVDAWEKAFVPQDFNGNAFPDDVDESGTGFVYYIMEGGEYETVAPVDAATYEAWRAAYIGNASELSIAYMPLTDENIAALS